jgi:hypothetical protein
MRSTAEIIRQQSENERYEAFVVWREAAGFIQRAEIASEILDGVSEGRVKNAFLEGLRLGLMYERILSIIDGRFRERWVQQERRRTAANTVNRDHAELQPQYQEKVDRLMADGLSYAAACLAVAKSLGVNERTVRRHTKNPAPRHRGRHPK